MDAEEKQMGSPLNLNQHGSNSGPQIQHGLSLRSKPKPIGFFLCFGLLVSLAVIILLIILIPGPPPIFPTDGDMLDYLVRIGEIGEPDGLFATWYHRANSKEEMNAALALDSMILEADVNLHGKGTAEEKPIPIMAHPPKIYSDNTLDEWLDVVLASQKGIKLDFKSLDSVGLSLDVLSEKHRRKRINRPVWLNADIVRGPNTPSFVPPINGTQFLQLVQEKFPDVTVSPGWMVLYLPSIAVKTYTRQMMEDMYELIKDVPQRVTFPIFTVLARGGWQHISWLLGQSSRFSLTLWQDNQTHPNVSDLLFIRDNTHISQVYYDIYEPTLSQFKEAAKQQSDVRRFYPGGDLMDFPVHQPSRAEDSLVAQWRPVTDRTSLSTQLSDGSWGMLVIQVAGDPKQPGLPLVEGFGRGSEAFTLQEVLELLAKSPELPWGVYLQIQSQKLLEASLEVLASAYSSDGLYRPVWITMDGLHSTEDTNDFISTVDSMFPYVTLVLSQQTWPPQIPTSVGGLSQRVALHLNAASLPQEQGEVQSLMDMMDRYDVIVQQHTEGRAADNAVLQQLMGWRRGKTSTHLYLLPAQL